MSDPKRDANFLGHIKQKWDVVFGGGKRLKFIKIDALFYVSFYVCLPPSTVSDDTYFLC